MVPASARPTAGRTLEWLARVYWHARLAGSPRTLTVDQLDEVREATRTIRYGEPDPG